MVLFNNHPILMTLECRQDIERLNGIVTCSCFVTVYDSNLHPVTEAKLDGRQLLSLDKGSIEKFQFSSGFKKPLLKVIEDLVCHHFYCVTL